MAITLLTVLCLINIKVYKLTEKCTHAKDA